MGKRGKSKTKSEGGRAQAKSTSQGRRGRVSTPGEERCYVCTKEGKDGPCPSTSCCAGDPRSTLRLHPFRGLPLHSAGTRGAPGMQWHATLGIPKCPAASSAPRITSGTAITTVQAPADARPQRPTKRAQPQTSSTECVSNYRFVFALSEGHFRLPGCLHQDTPHVLQVAAASPVLDKHTAAAAQS